MGRPLRLREGTAFCPAASGQVRAVCRPGSLRAHGRLDTMRLSTGMTANTAAKVVRAISRLAAFLPPASHLAHLDRQVIERYLADLHAALAGTKPTVTTSASWALSSSPSGSTAGTMPCPPAPRSSRLSRAGVATRLTSTSLCVSSERSRPALPAPRLPYDALTVDSFVSSWTPPATHGRGAEARIPTYGPRGAQG